MRRKKGKIVGLTLIIGAILLQVGYAATVNIEGINGTADYKVVLECSAGAKDDYITEPTIEDIGNGTAKITVGNLYPGGKFTVNNTIRNTGAKDVLFKGIDIAYVEGEKELYNSLVIYEEDKEFVGLETYESHLAQAMELRYKDNIFKSGEAALLPLTIGMSPDEIGLQGKRVNFKISLIYEQYLPTIEEGGTGNTTSNNSPNTDPTQLEKVPSEPTQIEEEAIPGGPAQIEEEAVPGEPVTIEEEAVPGGPAQIEEEDLPVGPTKLPQTGGLPTLFIYGIGIVMLGSGISIYRMSKKQE
ncbi:hypothetical protein CS063_10255 [Sporanaerobium hydrogeniformans]|uniref:Uncharacterized protein n=1 Tax=Sporanaerobium hydrogeniformans TaxID=3072179 RepID=A0AC61DD09_9FIRM|nr:LPXTG cell wall anchor domain-containing protein [Sporanaerobium hydrogeniformans]PHV70462.1 hypothetical protein CS063_10255 [Sporanaerobium hydrogeniformans]